jgi:hypothetical protein
LGTRHCIGKKNLEEHEAPVCGDRGEGWQGFGELSA